MRLKNLNPVILFILEVGLCTQVRVCGLCYFYCYFSLLAFTGAGSLGFTIVVYGEMTG